MLCGMNFPRSATFKKLGGALIAGVAIFFGNALAEAPGDLSVYVCQAEARSPQERIAACTTVLSRPDASTATIADALFFRGTLLGNEGEHIRAIADLTRSIELVPNSAGAFVNRGNQFLAMNDNGRAIADYDAAIALDNNHAIAFMQRGIARKRQGDLTGAVAEYNEAIRIAPQLPEAFFNRGLALGLLRDTDRAMADFDEAIRLNPDYAKAYQGRCWVRTITLSQPELGLADCNRSLSLRPDDPVGLDNRGFLNLLIGDNRSALSDYDAAVRLDADYAGSLYGRGLARVRLGQRRAGQADLRAAEAMDPNVASMFEAVRTPRR